MFINSACVLPVGAYLDACGPRRTAVAGAAIFAAGLLALAAATAISAAHPLALVAVSSWKNDMLAVSDLCYFVAFALLALGGPCIFTATVSE